MLDFVIFAITMVIALIAAVIYLYPGSAKPTTVPGMTPTDPREGNIPDIRAAGSLHEFLLDLHDEYGPIASFWLGSKFTISLASPVLWKEQMNVFDRPGEMFEVYKPLLGENSMFFTNGAPGRKRQQTWVEMFHEAPVSDYKDVIKKLVEDLADKWALVPTDEHIPLHEHMMALAMKIVLHVGFGNSCWKDDDILNFSKNFDACWHELEAQLEDNTMSCLQTSTGITDSKRFTQALEDMRSTFTKLHADQQGGDSGGLLNKFVELGGMSVSEAVGECVTYTTMSVQPLACLLTWSIYFLSTHDSAQSILQDELLNKAGTDGGHRRYVNQVIKETLRTSVIVPYTARYQDIDVEIGGHIIPQGTPVVHALGASMQDETRWAMPNKFDPGRFSASEEKNRDEMLFRPYGFAGKRSCPGQSLVYITMATVLSVMCRKFKFHLVEGQVVKPIYKLITRPEDEIWISVSKQS